MVGGVVVRSRRRTVAYVGSTVVCNVDGTYVNAGLVEEVKVLPGRTVLGCSGAFEEVPVPQQTGRTGRFHAETSGSVEQRERRGTVAEPITGVVGDVDLAHVDAPSIQPRPGLPGQTAAVERRAVQQSRVPQRIVGTGRNCTIFEGAVVVGDVGRTGAGAVGVEPGLVGQTHRRATGVGEVPGLVGQTTAV